MPATHVAAHCADHHRNTIEVHDGCDILQTLVTRIHQPGWRAAA
jgi:hypothetical protein